MSVVIHVGQCGNQLGEAFWRLAADAREAPSSSHAPSKTTKNKSGVSSTRPAPLSQSAVVAPTLYSDQYFHRRSRRARCILVDTEPKVIHAVLRGGWAPAHSHFEQSGRGNNWAMGYNLQTHQRNVLPSKSDLQPLITVATNSKTKNKLRAAVDSGDGGGDRRELVELVMESMRQEIEALDCYRGAMLMHSLGGGTGAGFGCRLLETIRDVYPRSYLTALSVAPSCASGDTPLQNYNALLTLQRLQQHTDCVVYKENDQLLKAASYWKALVAQASTDDQQGDKKVALREMNALVAADVAGLVFPIVHKVDGVGSKQPWSLAARPFDMAKLVHDCCPMPTAKFVDVRTGVSRGSSSTSKKVAIDPLFHAVSLAHTDDDTDDGARFAKLARQTMQSFPRWASGSPVIASLATIRCAGLDPEIRPIHETVAASLPRHHLGNQPVVTFSSYAPFQNFGGKAALSVALNNGHATTSVKHFLDRGQRQFHARAYTHWYKQFGLEDADFEHAFEECTRIVQHYDELLHV